MKRFKKTAAALVAVSMAAVLAACASQSTTGGSTQTAGTAATEGSGSSTVADTATAAQSDETVAAGKTLINVWTEDRHDQDYVQQMIDQYNQDNTDNIQIKLTVITEDYKNMISLAYNGGTAPDVVGANGLPLNQFADTGILIPLNDYIDADQTYQTVNEPYTHEYEGRNYQNGQIYFVFSGMRSGVRVEYNEDLLEKSGYTEIPDNLTDYVAMAQKVTDDGAGSYYGTGFTSSSPFERLLEMSAEISGVYYYDYINGKFDFSGYKPFIEKGQELVAAAYPDQQGVDNMRALFTEQSFALWSNASQEAGVFTTQLPITDFDWGVAAVPSLDGEIKGALETSPTKAYGIISTSQNQDAAWKVIAYFQSEEFLKGYLENGYCLPITDYMTSKIDSSKTGRLADFSKLEYEDVYPAVPSVNLQGDDYRTVLWNAVMGYVDADEAIEDLNTRYNDALDSDVANGSIKRLVIKDYDPLHPSAGTAEYLSE
ncbi:MAG: extracellular solute-binding protein [Oscillospiraceae bacterium]|nr:extracellular solute-binding protein [Oscillospiraceae bacterium]